MPLPKEIPTSSYISPCVTGSVPDPLCAVLPGDYKIPTSISDITAPFAKLPKLAVGIQQTQAAASLVKQFPGQLWASFGAFVKTLRPSQFMRLLLTPEHFTYGNNGMAKTAADFVAKLSAIQKAADVKATTPKTTTTSKTTKITREEYRFQF